MLVSQTGASPRAPDPPRTLQIENGALWLWLGVPLAVRVGYAVEALPPETVRNWIAPLHGFEADHAALNQTFDRVVERLAAGDEIGATAALHEGAPARLSPEGAALARAVAGRLGIGTPPFAVGQRSAPWGAGEIASDLGRFDAFGRSAVRLEKIWVPEKHPRWPKGAPDSQGGRFSPAGTGPPGGFMDIADRTGPPVAGIPVPDPSDPYAFPTQAAAEEFLKSPAGMEVAEILPRIYAGTVKMDKTLTASNLSTN